MDVTKPTIDELFAQTRRFVVPVYQREYVWGEEKHWAPLWSDVHRGVVSRVRKQRAGLVPDEHFMGAIVARQDHDAGAGENLPVREIIDGQQRMTTLQLMLRAFHDVLTHMHAEAQTQSLKDTMDSLSMLTWNRGAVQNENEDRYKVWPHEVNRAAFVNVMRPGKLNLRSVKKWRKQSGIYGAYAFFVEQLFRLLDNTEGEGAGVGESREERTLALSGVLRLGFRFVKIELADNDDPQVVFEALNGRGQPLLPSELIKNFLLQHTRKLGGNMQSIRDQYLRHFDEDVVDEDNEQDIVASEEDDRPEGEPIRFWRVPEKQGRLERPRMDLFVFHYMESKIQEEISITELSGLFRKWWEPGFPTLDAQTAALEDFKRASLIFKRFLASAAQIPVDESLRRLRAIDTHTIYPLLLYIFNDGVRSCRVQPAELLGIVGHLESYLVRRFMCRMETKKYNAVFIQLLREVTANANPITAERIADRLLKFEGPSVEWPTDDVFRREWIRVPIYSGARATMIKMILRAIDCALVTKYTDVGSDGGVSIEHVLPQKWSEENYPFPVAATAPVVGEVAGAESRDDRRKRLLHSMGNLTLVKVPLNSKLRNRPYLEKRGDITTESGLRINTYFQSPKITCWNEDEIETRSKELLKTALAIWPRPKTQSAVSLQSDSSVGDGKSPPPVGAPEQAVPRASMAVAIETNGANRPAPSTVADSGKVATAPRHDGIATELSAGPVATRPLECAAGAVHSLEAPDEEYDENGNSLVPEYVCSPGNPYTSKRGVWYRPIFERLMQEPHFTEEQLRKWYMETYGRTEKDADTDVIDVVCSPRKDLARLDRCGDIRGHTCAKGHRYYVEFDAEDRMSMHQREAVLPEQKGQSDVEAIASGYARPDEDPIQLTAEREDEFLRRLRQLGGKASSVQLRIALRWKEDRFVAIREWLIRLGKVDRVPGLGVWVQLPSQ